MLPGRHTWLADPPILVLSVDPKLDIKEVLRRYVLGNGDRVKVAEKICIKKWPNYSIKSFVWEIFNLSSLTSKPGYIGS